MISPMMKRDKVKVYLVGAGPGDKDLVTQTGIDYIRRADVIIYDNLIAKSLLKNKKPQARLIHVGKSPGEHSLPQAGINRLLIQQAKNNNIVVRLKGGDPFLFGRGSEEALALAKAGIRFEVVPGVSSAFAVSAYAGIPLTHRGISSQVTFVTGHEDPGKKGLSVDWSQLAKLNGTLVILMGMGRLAQIISRLVLGGMNKKVPVCIVQNGTLPAQKLVVGKISDIVNKARRKNITHPAVIIIGKVVNLRNKIKWYEYRPLNGKKILITRPLYLAEELSQKLEALGAETLTFPLIEVVTNKRLKCESFLKELVRADWVIFTSRSAVDICFDILNRHNKDLRFLSQLKVAALGRQTSGHLLKKGIIADLVPRKFFMESLVAEFKKKNLKGKRIFIPHSKQGRRLLTMSLLAQGAKVEEMFIYNVRCPRKATIKDLRALLEKEKFDIISFTSSSCVHQFMRLLSREKALLKKQTFAVIGPITEKTLQAYKYKANISAKVYDVDGLTKAITDYSGRS